MSLLQRPGPRWLNATLRRQLIWGVALVHAVMMSLFVYDLSLRQRDFLIESQADQAISLAQNLGLISATPLLSSDFSGLQELTRAISAYPGVVHVMVVLPTGKIVAHGDVTRRGQFAGDLARFAGALTPEPLVLFKTKALADVVVPVFANQDPIGWVRVGVSQSANATKLAAITESGLLYTALAILVGIVLAWVLANRLTRRLTQLAHVADVVSAGDTQVRATAVGRDELSHMARAFNFMLDTLERLLAKEHALQTALQSEKELAQVTLAAIGDAVITTNETGQVVFLNTVAQQLTGWAASLAFGQQVAEVFALSGSLPEDQTHPALLVLQTGHTHNSDQLVLRTLTERTLPIESLLSPIFSPNGQVLGCVLVFRDISEKLMAQDRLQWQAGHDSLTGLPNRVLLADRFERALEKARRDRTQLAVCLLDLDNFKPVNDTHGHAAGDALLVALTARLHQELRAVDTLSRLGGDEFVLLLEDLADQADLTAVLDRVLSALAEPFDIQGHTLQVTASLGVTVYPQDDSDADTLLRHADQAMYVAKQTGRNRYHRFDVLQDRQRESNHQTLARVRHALDQDELRLYYQPKVNLRSGAVHGFEALLRWLHPSDGMIPPLSFLPLVEQTEVIVHIGEWVITQALTQIAQWQQQGKAWPVSVNIAAYHFLQDDFLSRLEIMLRQPDL